MQGLLRHLIVPALALAGMAFAPTVGRAEIVGFEKVKGEVDKTTEKITDDLFGKVDQTTEKITDGVKGVPLTPAAVPEASSLAMMGVVVTVAAAGGLLRRARNPGA
jgi:hypothetical protein